ncbi:hypothetical protein K8354_17935 [Polaribacter litorisediminis]|uniref:hypothetical protein n=1 Tax=Polaribacter litorisediminis TaxID=1908341 RepID=UPI001CBEF6F2|nr:hypothetical protein [Polaribacter litorisediminis]UAM98132.1 hypothetical protein K8354_17935 [Polaribacter litorisediminis]
MKNNRFKIILVITVLILFIPLIAMQVTDEVNWKVFDFLIVGLLLVGTGVLLDFSWRKIGKLKYRIFAIITIAIVFLLIWAELAVGIFGTPFAGN